MRVQDARGNPLLRARYHFLPKITRRSLRTLRPTPEIDLERGAGDAGRFEVALCRECGQHYLVGVIKGNRLKEAVRDPGHHEFRSDYFRPLSNSDEKSPEGTLFVLCSECGQAGEAGQPALCDHNAEVLIEKVPSSKTSTDRALRCTACGYSAVDPVREIVYGNDGPQAVIATTLFSRLPPDRSKILAFADGRQEAAFFAWYLEDTYNSILHRNLIFRTLQKLHRAEPGGVSIEDAAVFLRTAHQEAKLLPPSTTGLGALRQATLGLYREFVTDQPRISLEGVGLIRWRAALTPSFSVPLRLGEPPWNLTRDEQLDLIQYLLDTVRQDGAVDLRSSELTPIDWSDLGIQRAQLSITIGTPGGRKRVRSWEGPQGRRSQFLKALLERNGLDTDSAAREADITLREIWKALLDADSERCPQPRTYSHKQRKATG